MSPYVCCKTDTCAKFRKNVQSRERERQVHNDGRHARVGADRCEQRHRRTSGDRCKSSENNGIRKGKISKCDSITNIQNSTRGAAEIDDELTYQSRDLVLR